MSDYFDQLESELKGALARRAHLRWYARLRLPVHNRGLMALVAVLVVATPTVAAVGAVSGWFSTGKPDIYYPASSTSGLGKVLPKGDRLLPIRVADPDGGPPWGVRLIRTTRGDTCLQVGRVENGEIGALGIDGAWGDDHLFHQIKPNDRLADICGATDSAGNGFVNQTIHGAPASVDVPLYNSGGGSPVRCRSPYAQLGPEFPSGAKLSPVLKRRLKQVQKNRSKSPVCPESSMRMVFAGLLGPKAQSIRYKTPNGQTRTEQTSGGVGAYLIVFRETKTNCADFTQTLMSEREGCQSDGSGVGADLQGPTAVTSVTYDGGKICSDIVPRRFAVAYTAFNEKMSKRVRRESTKLVRQQWNSFFMSQGLTARTSVQAEMPRCAPVGWVASGQKRVTAAYVRSPLKVNVSEGRRFCFKGSGVGAVPLDDTTIACDRRIPKGDKSYYESSDGAAGPLYALIRVSFTAREPVTTSNSFYEWNIQEPGNNGGENSRTQRDVRRGQRITFTMSEPIAGTGTYGNGNAIRGVYQGTIGFIPNVGEAGPEDGGGNPGHDGSLTVGTFSFKLPPRK